MDSLSAATENRLDQQALIDLYDQHSPGLYRYAYRLLGSQEQAEDCVSETFSRFLQAVRRGARPDNIQAYLYRTAHNWATDQYRRQPPVEPLDEEGHPDHLSNPSHASAVNLERERVRAALYRLPPDQRMVVALRFLEERSHDEVSAILGKSVEATRALQHRALASLRRMLLDTHKELEV